MVKLSVKHLTITKGHSEQLFLGVLTLDKLSRVGGFMGTGPVHLAHCPPPVVPQSPAAQSHCVPDRGSLFHPPLAAKTSSPHFSEP